MNMNSASTVHACDYTMQRQSYYSHTVHETHNYFIQKKILNMGLIALLTYLKIILLQCFQFSVFSKISCIQTDPILLLFVFALGQ